MLNKLFPSRTVQQHPAGSGPNRQYALACIPVRNPECIAAQKEEGTLLTYSVQAKPWLRKIFKGAAGREPEIMQRKLQLDSLGSSVWQIIDGQKSVEDISRIFQHKHQLGLREAEISVSEFIQQLGKRGLIALKEPREKAEEKLSGNEQS